MIDAESFQLHADALWSAGDPHIPDGVHLRLIPNPRLGLPLGPVVVERAIVTRDMATNFEEITEQFRAADGTPLAVGTKLAGETFTATFGPDDHVIAVWAYVTRPKARFGVISHLAFLMRGYTGDLARPRVVLAEDGDVVAGNVFSRITITGRGAVIDGVRILRWKDPALERSFTPVDLWSMPIPACWRYQPPRDPPDPYLRFAGLFQRRDGLADAPQVDAPGDAPPSSPGRERQRLGASVERLLSELGQVLADQSSTPLDQLKSSPIVETSTPGTQPVTTTLQSIPLQTAMSALLEPPLAGLLGLGAVQRSSDKAGGGALSAGNVAVYRLQACFALRHNQVNGGQDLDFYYTSFSASDAIPGENELNKRAPLLAPHGLPKDALRIMEMGDPAQAMVVPVRATVAVAIGASSPVAVPKIEAVLDPEDSEPPEPSAWRQDGTRSLRLKLAPSATGMIAMSRDSGSGRQPANAQRSDGFREPLMPHTDAGMTPWIFDSGAPAESFVYRIAMRDGFGRWSGRQSITADAGRRPLPPGPSVRRTPLTPVVPAGNGAVASQIALEVEIPAKLVAGSLPVKTLVVRVDGAAVYNGPPPTVWPWRSVVNGPALLPAASATVTVTAHVESDTGSGPDGTASFVVRDPRPPIAPDWHPPVGWTSFPDAEGLAWIELDIPTGGNAVRVYHSDERVLRAGMAPPASVQAGALADEAAKLPLPTSASMTNPANWFEMLTEQPLRATSGTTVRFRTPVPGGTEQLTFLRVAWVGSNLVETPFKDSTFLAFAVPPTTPPRRPSVEPIVTWTAGVPTVRLSIHVNKGAVAPERLRVLKTLNEPRHPLDAKVLSDTAFVPSVNDAAEGPWTTTVDDTAARRWITVWYSAQVAGKVPSIALPWSEPSPVVALRLIPPEPPPVIQARRRTDAQGKLFLNLDVPTEWRVLRVRLVRGTQIGVDSFTFSTTEKGFDAALPAASTAANVDWDEVTATDALAAFLVDPIGRSTPVQIAET
jgi:hypothetical protein